jgi:hypothetical protein
MLRFAGLVILVGALIGLLAAAEAVPPLEYQVKAAFLLNFTKFTDWPPPETAVADIPFDICIIGEDPFGTALDQMVEGEKFQGRRIAVQRVRRPAPGYCQVLFVGKGEKDIEGLLLQVGPGVLTVGEEAGFLRAGGMIDFVVENRRVRFDVNQGAVARAGLKISSKLLSVARSVEK